MDYNVVRSDLLRNFVFLSGHSKLLKDSIWFSSASDLTVSMSRKHRVTSYCVKHWCIFSLFFAETCCPTSPSLVGCYAFLLSYCFGFRASNIFYGKLPLLWSSVWSSYLLSSQIQKETLERIESCSRNYYLVYTLHSSKISIQFLGCMLH